MTVHRSTLDPASAQFTANREAMLDALVALDAAGRLVAAAGAAVLASPRPLAPWFWAGLQAGTAAGLVFVHCLAWQSSMVIGALCPYCIAVWIVTITAFVHVTARNATARNATARNATARKLATGDASGGAGAGDYSKMIEQGRPPAPRCRCLLPLTRMRLDSAGDLWATQLHGDAVCRQQQRRRPRRQGRHQGPWPSVVPDTEPGG